jgi:hypothetical protein
MAQNVKAKVFIEKIIANFKFDGQHIAEKF